MAHPSGTPLGKRVECALDGHRPTVLRCNDNGWVGWMKKVRDAARAARIVFLNN